MLLGACASQPKTPQENADAAAVMGMMLMASAAQQKGSAASALWQVRIPPAAIEVIARIQTHRRTSGTWPQREDIPLPESITELLLHATDEDLVVMLKKGDRVAARFTILKDGTVLAAPLVEDLMSAMQSRSGSSVPFVPVLPPAKK
jgi:hypothetical protein